MQRKRLRKSDIRDMNEELKAFGSELSKKDAVEIVSVDDSDYVSVNGEIRFFYHDGNILPTLKSLLDGAKLKKIVVDMGAIRFVASGADIMRPGITAVDPDINKGDAVVVVDENNDRPLAVGIALLDASDINSAESGKSIKNIHFVGDDIWNIAI